MREDYCQACGKRVGDRECAHGILCKKCDKEEHGAVNASCELERESEMRDRIGREDREGPYDPMIYFHATPAQNLASIKEKGLLLKPPVDKVWPHGPENVICVAANRMCALAYVRQMTGTPIVLLEINLDGLAVAKQYGNGFEHVVYQDITPDRIVGYTSWSWKQSKKGLRLVKDGQNPERVPEVEKPVVKLTGTNGNIFAILGACTKALKKAGQKEAAEGLFDRVTHAGSYDEALRICMEYVDVQ